MKKLWRRHDHKQHLPPLFPEFLIKKLIDECIIYGKHITMPFIYIDNIVYPITAGNCIIRSFSIVLRDLVSNGLSSLVR